MNQVRTRFAPSPTGYLHIGGVRTALFNWLFARKHGGQFILRIDDTDQQRNVKEALQPILDGFRWLGLDWDEGAEVGGPHGPYYQSQRGERYKEVVKQLLEKGAAYYDYATTDEMKAEREAADKEKRQFVYSRRYADFADEGAKRKAASQEGIVRLKMPREGNCTFADHIRGDMVVPWISEQDHTIARADGSVLYNLANIVDDYDMKISHVIRAEEHLANTPRQIFMIDQLGWPRPDYAHVPFVAEPGSKNKISKRKIATYLKNADFKKIYEHGRCIAERIGLAITPETFNPVMVEFYQQVGYLPQAIVNYLVLLGWSLDDKTEFFTRDEMIRHFSLERVNSSAASFDIKKLFAFQEKYMQEVPVEKKTEMCLPFLQKAGRIQGPEQKSKVEAIVRAAGDRIKVAGDILDYAYFFHDGEITIDEPAFEKNLKKVPEAVSLLSAYRDHLAAADKFDAASLEKTTEEFLQSKGTTIKQLHAGLRLALTGKTVSFSLWDTLAILGKERSLQRIELALSRSR